MEKTVYIFYSCNAWKEYSSMHLIGVAADTETLCAMVGAKIKEGDVLYRSDSSKKSWELFLEDYKRDDVRFELLDFGYIEEQPVYSGKVNGMVDEFPMIRSVWRKMRECKRMAG